MACLRELLGQDYHTIMRKRLDKLSEFLREKVPDVEIQSMVDTGVLSDRAVAERRIRICW